MSQRKIRKRSSSIDIGLFEGYGESKENERKQERKKGGNKREREHEEIHFCFLCLNTEFTYQGKRKLFLHVFLLYVFGKKREIRIECFPNVRPRPGISAGIRQRFLICGKIRKEKIKVTSFL